MRIHCAPYESAPSWRWPRRAAAWSKTEYSENELIQELGSGPRCGSCAPHIRRQEVREVLEVLQLVSQRDAVTGTLLLIEVEQQVENRLSAACWASGEREKRGGRW